MGQERSERVNAIAQSAIHKEPGDRSGFLRGACSDDPSLISEVESLLAVYDRTGSLPDEEVLDYSEEELDVVPSRADEPFDVVGGKIGKYEIVERIGHGSMGVVYKARDPLMDRFVGIKTMPPEVSSALQIRKRFYREARSAGKLSHKNIITVHDLGEHKGRPYIAMEFLVGEDLKSKLERRERPSLEEQIRWMIETCEGLEHAHRKQVIHRDIKPGNIFITQEGHVKILDFGLARIASSVGTKSGLVVGTPSYMAPEQVRGEKADRRADIYSCAATFFELLTNEKPHTSESLHGLFYKILEVEPKSIDTLNPLLPRELAEVISRAMAKRPEERFESAEKLGRALTEVKASLRERKSEMRREVREALSQLEEAVGKYRELWREQGVVDPVGAKGAEGLLAELGVSDVEDDATIQLDTVLDYLTLVETVERAKREKEALSGLIEEFSDANELLQKAEETERQGALDEGLRFAQQALERAPEHGAAKKLASRIKSELTRRAEEEANRRQKIASLLEEAERLFSRGDLESCRSRADSILKMDPTHSRALELGREALARLEGERKRQQAARRAEEIVQKAEAHLLERDDPEACLALLEQAAAVVPEHPKVTELGERASRRLAELKELEQKRERALEFLSAAASAIREGHLKEARRELERAQKEYRELTGIPELYRELAIAEQKQAERERRLRRAKELLTEAERQVAVGDEEAVLGRLDEILELDPANQRAIELKGQIEEARAEKKRQAQEALASARKAKRAGELEEAITLCGSVLLDFPGHEEAKTMLMEAESDLRARRNHERREARMRDLIACADKLAEQGELDATITLLERAQPTLADHPRVKEALAYHRGIRRDREIEARKKKQFEEKRRLAKAFFQEGDFERSEREAEDALRLRPEDPEMMLLFDEVRCRAKAERTQRELEEKIGRILDKALSLMERGKDKAALKRARAVLELDPSNQKALGMQADLLQRIEERQLHKQIDRKLSTARSAVKRKRVTEALEHLQDVLDLDPSQSEALDLKAELLRQREEKERRAREMIEMLLERARRAEESGRPRKALALVRSALLVDQNNKDALELVNRLKDLNGLDEELLQMEMTDTSPTAETVVNIGTLESAYPSWWQKWRLPAAVLAFLAIAVAIAAIYARRTSPVAPPDVGFVWVDISPWARITSVHEKATGRSLPIRTAATPCLLELPTGVYEIEFANHISPANGLVSELELGPSETMFVEGALPDFDEAQVSLLAKTADVPQTEVDPPQEGFEQRLNEIALLIAQGRTREVELQLYEMESLLPGHEEADEMRTRIDDLCIAMDERIAKAYEDLQGGLESLSRRNFEDARRQLEKAIALDIGRDELREILSLLGQEASRVVVRESVREARFALRQGRREDVEPRLELARLVHPESEEIERIVAERQLMENAWRHYQQGEYEQAKSMFQEALARDPDNLHAQQQIRRIEDTGLNPQPARSFQDLVRLARDSIERQEIRVAYTALQDARELLPDDPALVSLQKELQNAAQTKARDAIRLIFSRRYNQAVPDLEDCLVVLDDLPALHLHLGWAYYVEYLKGRETDDSLLEKSGEQLRHALRLEPDLKTDPRTSSPRLTELLDAVRQGGADPRQ